MKRAARALPLLVVLVLTLGACSSSSPSSPRVGGGDASVDASVMPAVPAPQPVAVLREVKPVLRVLARTGEVIGLGSDEITDSEQLLRLAPGATLELALADYARLSVRGPATVLLAPQGAPALLLRDGVLTVDCAAPVLPSAAPALWVATATVRLEVAQRARFVVRSSAHASMFSLVSGVVRVRHGATTFDVAEDGTRCFGGTARWRHTQPLRGRLQARSEAVVRARSCRRAAGEPSDADLEDELRRKLASFESMEADERDLLARHRALSQSSPAAAAEEQWRIALQASRLMELSDELRARHSVLAARFLDATSPTLRALLARAREAAP